MGTGKRVKSIAVIASAALIFCAFVAPADANKKTKRTERTAEATYYGAAILACYAPEGIGCTRFATTAKEKYVSIEIADTLSSTVYARVSQPLDEDSTLLTDVATICGRSEEPIPITPGADVVVFVSDTNGQGGMPGQVACPGAVSSGTIKMVFSNLP
jgi:hypothetical protein